MKTLFVCVLLAASQVYASEIHLSTGDSIVLSPSTTTRVTCEVGTAPVSNCAEARDALEKLINACKTAYTAAFCTDKYFPRFKAQNPSCASAALDLCLAGCQTSYTGAFCADRCSQ